MFWNNKKIEPEIPWGRLCIKPDWNGQYYIYEWGIKAPYIYEPYWHKISGGFKQKSLAIKRIKFMDREGDYKEWKSI